MKLLNNLHLAVSGSVVQEVRNVDCIASYLTSGWVIIQYYHFFVGGSLRFIFHCQ